MKGKVGTTIGVAVDAVEVLFTKTKPPTYALELATSTSTKLRVSIFEPFYNKSASIALVTEITS